MKRIHYASCLVGVGAAVVLFVALGAKASTVGVLAVALACPLMMLVMMRTMMGDKASSSHHSDHPVDHGQDR